MSGWLADTFIDSNGAEVALCAGRPGFLQSGGMELVPHHIWRYIVHSRADGHIEGFRRLFDHLNMEATADDLRQLVVGHFNSTPYLRNHLRYPGAGAPTFKMSVPREGHLDDVQKSTSANKLSLRTLACASIALHHIYLIYVHNSLTGSAQSVLLLMIMIPSVDNHASKALVPSFCLKYRIG